MDSGEILRQARTHVGQHATCPATARDPVNLPMIRRWCEAMGETNPIYTDESAALAAGHAGIVAPPAMLEVWTMSPYRATGRLPEEAMPVMQFFDSVGYTGVVATNIEQQYDRYLQLGDTVSMVAVVDDVSDEKRTGLGVGHFITLRYEFTDQLGRPVGRMMFRILKFLPKLKDPLPPARPATAAGESYPHPRPAITHDNQFFWEGLSQRRLLIQRCAGCGHLRHPPGPMCPTCHSLEWNTLEASGHGQVYSYVIVHQPRLPGFRYPLTVLTVDLAEGTRLVANLLEEHEPAATAPVLTIGSPVRLDFREVEPGYVLPAFRLVRGAE
ncbi:MAG: bifunctional MaoC family dehydratase N-terminal/OB-fold nucleic acid binding domain-containing protein [Gammaproteobacteria bacterium]